jgi:hypothetical protein
MRVIPFIEDQGVIKKNPQALGVMAGKAPTSPQSDWFHGTASLSVLHHLSAEPPFFTLLRHARRGRQSCPELTHTEEEQASTK